MKQVVYAISDSSGETASNFSRSMLAQFPTIQMVQKRFSFIKNPKKLIEILDNAKTQNALVFYTLNSFNLDQVAKNYEHEQKMLLFDVLSPYVSQIEKFTEQQASHEIGASRRLNSQYFKRIEAIDFAAENDDGKNPHGILEADVVLLGISRTSKTPLSFFLANQGIKAMNLPLVPNVELPKQIWQIKPQKIVGLTNDEEVLGKIRTERLRSYGLDVTGSNNYSDINKIRLELQQADELYKKLNCLIINVANKSIEEVAAIIENKLQITY